MNEIPPGARQLAEMKGGKLFQHETQLYFQTKHSTIFTYEVSILDYLLEWGQRDLHPNAESLKLIKSIKSFIPDEHPCCCTFSDGIVSQYCIIEFSDHPPDTYTRSWRYYDEVMSVAVSSKVVTNEMVLKMEAMKNRSQRNLEKIKKIRGSVMDNPKYQSLLRNNDVVVRDKKGRVFKFSDPTIFIYYPDINIDDLALVNNPTDNEIHEASLLSVDYLGEYERRDFVPPVKTIVVYADK